MSKILSMDYTARSMYYHASALHRRIPKRLAFKKEQSFARYKIFLYFAKHNDVGTVIGAVIVYVERDNSITF